MKFTFTPNLDKQCKTEDEDCPFTECVVGQHWWVYTIARVEASHREIQLIICNFSVLRFLVLLQALFGNDHFSYRKNVFLLLSVACGGDG